jgi:hypothetical protein
MHETFNWRWIESETARTAAAWSACGGLPLHDGPCYTAREQRKHEKAFDKAIRTTNRAIDREMPRASLAEEAHSAMQQRLAAVFPPFATAALGLKREATRLIAQGFFPIGIEFARASRRFDSSLTMASIIQACRNAWTVCGLQPLLGERMCLTPSILGYSLLYPYTDNYLDRTDKTPESKHSFCRRFRNRLRASSITAENAHESAVWALVEMIEGEFPRTCYPQVYDSLLAIHRAQEESIVQLAGKAASCESDLLRISFAKGGSSVLADACLVRGWLHPHESRLAFDWGALLQLGDDLQDVHEDLHRGSATLFTRAVAQGVTLDALTTQLLNFSQQVGFAIDGFTRGSPALKDLLRISWRSIIVAAIGNSHEFYSPAFLAEIERFSPFRFAFLRERRERLAGRRGLYQSVFSALVDKSPITEQNLASLPAVAPKNQWPNINLQIAS